jgi:hypothetical protein
MQDGLAFEGTSCEGNWWKVGAPWVGFYMRKMNGEQFVDGKTGCG